ncbi:MAG: hypothetical protein QOG53_806 [Frankiales bacterium]|jgi:hypothetical protein|nr:hypothetical protein [Frankiales bacterium]
MTAASKVRTLGASAVVCAIVAALFTGWGGPTWWAVPLLATVVAISEIAVVHLQFGRQRWAFSLTEGAIAAGFAVHGGTWPTVAVAAGVLVAQTIRRQPRIKLEYNVAQFAAGTALGALMATTLGSGISGACAGMGVFWLVNHGLVAVAVALTTRRPIGAFVWDSAPLSAIHSAGNSSIGLLATWLAQNAPVGLLGLLVPMGLLYTSYDQQTRRAAEARLFAELARGQEEATGRSADTSAQVVLTAAARLFGGADVEMVLLAADGPVRYSGDEFGIRSRRRVDPAAFDEPWVLRVLGNHGIRTGFDDGRPYCSALIGEPDDPRAAIIARRVPGAAGFGRREAMLAGVLVTQAESWLSVAGLTAERDQARERAEQSDSSARRLADLGADSAPALVVLRESANRLARLAAAPAGEDPIGDIVDELHAVERAVASLLGAIALAAEPDLASDLRAAASEVPVVPAARGVSDWTTTGVLEGADLKS